jgi:putative membrane protein
MMLYGNGYGMHTWQWITMTVVLVALVALVAAAVAYLGRFFLRPGEGAAFIGTAERTLAERFARGDINAEEYQERLRVLRIGLR